ncbi:GDP/GTP exchange factor for ARF, partial [Cryomyces antarcticus]
AQLWRETWTRLDRFLPTLMPELFPEEAKKPPSRGKSEMSALVAGAREKSADADEEETVQAQAQAQAQVG